LGEGQAIGWQSWVVSLGDTGGATPPSLEISRRPFDVFVGANIVVETTARWRVQEKDMSW
jgi:hypothetical protein